ncbi:hypothetical protein IGI04_008866 [Brassica rapa subsp. trilocularis]|uniref:DnaJ homologue subfamily C member 28 conserved domain-containing protein n=1 Tax=Brassica rapa subsp. trilocularis TaxID=1813537 RepID=A0ABQ7MVL4_BRACM|nr:hypothetical protein IGI04_008866 [Brassica rapa subsp. trilocularis]
MAVRLARSSSSRPSLISIVNRISDFAYYSSSSSWWSSPEDLTAGSKRREKKTTDRFSAAIDAVHDRKLPPELRGRRDFVSVVAHTAVVEAYAKAGQPEESLKVFVRMLACGVLPNAYTYTVLIRGLAGDGKTLKGAEKYLLEMMGKGMRPNAATYAAVSETDIINVVEQRIWHSMEEGQFENLPGKGKPLNVHTNPHADPAEDTLYRILNKNGFAPEWVELNKDIRSKAKEWRVSLKKAWAMKLEDDQSGWEEQSNLLKTQLKQINNMASLQLNYKSRSYNLIVPFGRQMFGLKWEKEIDRLKE